MLTAKRKRTIGKQLGALALSALLLLGTGCEKRQITDTTAKVNGEVSACNEVVTELCTGYFKGKVDLLNNKTDQYYPVSTEISWKYTDPAAVQQADVLLSRNADLSDAQVYLAAGEGILVDGLMPGTDYYWQVRAQLADSTVYSSVFHFRTAENFLTYRIGGVANTRDLGGLTTASGKKIRTGMIIRGANVDSINSEGKLFMTEVLGVRTDLDLRAPNEGTAGQGFSPISKEINYVNYSGILYGDVSNPEKQAVLADEIRVFTKAENYPVYIHCAIGRDRTGTLSMLLEALLGVPEKLIYRDYEMSFLSALCNQDEVDAKTMIGINFDPTVNYINSFEGKTLADRAENYLKSIGLTQAELDAIKDIMLE